MADSQHGKANRAYAVAAAVLLIFIWLGHEVSANRTLAFDGFVRNAIHAWASAPLTMLMKGITQMGAPPLLIAVALIVGWRFSVNGEMRLAVLLALSTIGAAAADETLKLIYHRVRPAAFFGYDEPMTYSFPSGHANTSICFYGLLAILVSGLIRSAARRRALWAAATVLVLLIGLSRVYLGVHYPTDVLGGYAFGVAWIIGVLRAAPASGKRFRPS